jgi:biopolymer transport protein ExbB
LIVAIIAVFGVLSGEVWWRKSRMLRQISVANGRFMQRFEALPLDALEQGGRAALGEIHNGVEHSALSQVCHAGIGEFNKVADLFAARGKPMRMTPEIVEVIRSAIEGEIVRQAARMNRDLVTLTLAVSAAPFLGLLGTVVGIMVTFGAITLSGDVNVNTIAPGVAAALVTTVAGLVVAIPVMFGYNRLATNVRDLTASMETFANDLLARMTIANVD